MAECRSWYSETEERQQIDYAVTDRPVYRPGDTVHFRLWVRELAGRTYQRPRADQAVTIEIQDPADNVARTLSLRTDRFGGVTGDFPLSAEAALGAYAIAIRRANDARSEPAGQFRVEMYKKPEFEVTVQPAEEAVRAGSSARVRVAARYYFGGPVAGAQVRYQIFREGYQAATPRSQPYDWLYGPGYGHYNPTYAWLGGSDEGFHEAEEDDYTFDFEDRVPIRRGEACLTEAGTVEIEMDAGVVGQRDQRLTIEVEVRDASRRTIRGKGSIVVARQDLAAMVETDRAWYRPENPVQVEIGLHSAVGAGVAAKGTLRLTRISYHDSDHQQVRMETVRSWDVETDSKGRLTQSLPPFPEGQYRVEFQTHDSRNHEVTAGAVFWVHGPRLDTKAFRYRDLEVLPDQRTYKVGETAHLLVHVAQPNARVLWCDDARAGRLQTYRFIDIADHVVVIPVRIEARHVPNFFVEATVVGKGQAHVETCELLVPPVQELLQVKIKTDKAVYRPGEDGAVQVIVTDAAGKPVSGQLTLTAYDKAVTYIQDETGIGPNQLIVKRKVEHQPDRFLDLRGWRLQGQGTFVCPEFEIYDRGHRQIGMMGGAPPQGGDPSGASRAPAHRPGSVRRGSERETGGTEPVIRRNFADTALWRAAIELGPDGTTMAKLAWPQSLTTWRLRAYALTEATQLGDASAEAITSKNLLVRLQTPRFLVEGDEVVLSANVHNAFHKDQRVATELMAPTALLDGPPTTTPDPAGKLHLRGRGVVKAAGSERFDWRLRAIGHGTAAVTVKALAEEESDAMQVAVPILPHGVRQQKAWAGAFQPGETATQTFTLAIPDKCDPEQTKIDVSLAPGPIGAMLDALPMLMGYPYGCTEQTMSRFYPTIIAANTLKKLGTNLEALAGQQRQGDSKLAGRFHALPGPVYDSAELRQMAQAGLERLYNFQHRDGGWGWWRDDASSPYMTAYVLMGLQLTQQAGLEVRQQALDYGYHHLFRAIDPQARALETAPGQRGVEVEAYIAYVLSWAAGHKGKPGGLTVERFGAENSGLQRLRSRLFGARGELNSYGLALLSLAMCEGNEENRAREVLQELLQRVERDHKNGTAWVATATRGWWHWWNSDIESNAWALRALVRIEPRHELAARLARWLVLHRHNGTFWQSTRDSALAVAALADHLVVQRAEAPDCRAVIRLDGRVVKEVLLTADNLLPPGRLALEARELTPGPHVLTLQKTGHGELYYACRLETFAKQDTLQAERHGLALKREYARLAADGSKRAPLADGASVPVGDLVEVVLTIDADDDYDYVAFEDPKPAGCEPVQLQSGALWLNWGWTNVELRDDRVGFFVSYLRRGPHVLRYRLRAETPGVFRVLPAVGFAMYAPAIQASSAGFRLRVQDK